MLEFTFQGESSCLSLLFRVHGHACNGVNCPLLVAGEGKRYGRRERVRRLAANGVWGRRGEVY